MRRSCQILSILATLTVALPAPAEEILYFTNGTFMPIRSHKLDGEMIHVDMGENNFMAFPSQMVEKILDGGKDVLLRPSTAAQSNQMLGYSGADGSYPVFGTRPANRTSMGWQAEKGIETPENDAPKPMPADKHGMATSRPFGSAGGGRSKMAVTGNVWGGKPATNREQGIVGTTRIGSKYVIGAQNHPKFKSGGLQIVGDGPAVPVATAPPPAEDPNSGGQQQQPEPPQE